MGKSYHSEEFHPSLWTIQHLPDSEKNLYSSKIEAYESDEDEEILHPTKIPRHICLRMKKRLSGYQSEDDESSEDGESSEDDTDGEDEEKFLPVIEVVVHNLPPYMKEEEFFKRVSPLPAHHYKYFVEARDLSWATHVGAHGFMDASLYIFDAIWII